MTNLMVFSSFQPLLGLRNLLNTHLYPMGTGSEMSATPQLESDVKTTWVGGTSRCMKQMFLSTSGSHMLHL